jgi:hypothetical protein
MAKFKAFTLKFTQNQIAVIRRLFSGEKMTRYRIRFSMCRGIRASQGTYDFANGGRAPYTSVESLKSQGVIREKREDETLVLGFHDYTYAYSLSEDVIRGIMDSVTPTGKSLLNFIF